MNHNIKHKKLHILNIFLAILILLLAISVTTIYSYKPFDEPKQISQSQVLGNSISGLSPIVQKAINRPIKMLFLGDTMLGQTVGKGIKAKNEDPFMHVKDFMKNYDYIYANLECNLSDENIGVEAPGKAWHFKAPVEAISTLKNAGVNIVGMANNHSMDFGSQALLNEIDHLNKGGIKYFGAGKNIEEAFKPTITEVKGVKIAFLGYNDIETFYTAAKTNSPGSAFFDKPRIKAGLAEAKQKADLVIVTPHWGTEGLPNSDAMQREYSKFFIDNGADLVVGNHPHSIQNDEEYKGKKIFYALGNFIFEAASSGPSKYGNMLEIVIEDKQIKSSKLTPVEINYSFPKIIEKLPQ